MDKNTAKFLLNRNEYSIHMEDRFISLKCRKVIKPKQSQSLSSFHKSIPLLQVISSASSSDVLQVDTKGRPTSNSKLLCSSSSNLEDWYCLTINFWIKEKQHRRKLQKVVMLTRDEEACVEWQKRIEVELKLELKKQGYVRPKSLLVFVNPFAGMKKAKTIHKNVASPIFKLAGTKETVVITQHAGHAKEHIAATDMSSYDGIIAIGGDSTFNEVANGMLINEQKRHNIPLDDSNVLNQPISFVTPKIRIGMIAGGAANAICWSSHGTNDPESCVLQIISGECHPLDICSVYDDEGKFVGFSDLCCIFGLWASLAKLGESLRMFGPRRYDIALIRLLLKHQSHPCQISYLESSPDNPVDVNKEKSKCRYPCSVCLKPTDRRSCVESKPDHGRPADVTASLVDDPDMSLNGNPSDDVIETTPKDTFAVDNKRWKVVRGRFHMVNLTNNVAIYAKAPHGFAPSAHMADGTADLVMLHSTSRSALINYMGALRGADNLFDFPFVEVHRIKGYRMQPLHEGVPTSRDEQKNKILGNETSCSESLLKKSDASQQDYSDTTEGVWSVDGDFMNSRSFTVWVHKGLVNLFAKGIENE